jgi:prepilin-type N-terminal cleavage/methylation domain-containing protein
MLTATSMRGFTLVEALVALALMLAGLAGGSLLLLQSMQYERESSNRRAAMRFAASLAEELRALDGGDGLPLAADSPAIITWIGAVESTMPAGSTARVHAARVSPAGYQIEIEWPVAGSGRNRLVLPVTL